jgi:uncharacterized glyoxalase superfamily protein PhnB
MNVKKITAILFVEQVDPCVQFWVERFGFEKAAEVPEGDRLAFAMLQKANVELMYQSYASADQDVGAISQAVRKARPSSMSKSTTSTRPSPPSKMQRSSCPSEQPFMDRRRSA